MQTNFYIVGAAKSGTTAIYNILKQSNEVFFSTPKEPNYFCSKIVGLNKDELIKNGYMFELNEYEKLFEKANGEKIIGEASVKYLYYFNSAIEIKKYSPNAKILIILRNPVERSFSSFNHLRRVGLVGSDFEESLKKESEHGYQDLLWKFKGGGMYYEGVKMYMDIFGENCKVVFYDDFKKDPEITIVKICQFLGIKKINFEKRKKYNQSGNPTILSKMLRAMVTIKNSNVILKNTINIIVPSRKYREIILYKMFVLFSNNKSKLLLKKETEKNLKIFFRDDIEKLEELLTVDLKHWK